jgi:hypothetical protein
VYEKLKRLEGQAGRVIVAVSVWVTPGMLEKNWQRVGEISCPDTDADSSHALVVVDAMARFVPLTIVAISATVVLDRNNMVVCRMTVSEQTCQAKTKGCSSRFSPYDIYGVLGGLETRGCEETLARQLPIRTPSILSNDE